MELLLVIFCIAAYIKTFEPLCLVAVGLLMIAWEIWFANNKKSADKEDKF